MTHRILVLVIEDNRVVRDGLAALLDAQPGLKVVAAVGDADAGLREVREAKPHVVLVDAALGNNDSHRLVHRIQKEAPESKVIVMDLLPAQDDVIAFVKAGARGLLVKDATIDDFASTIRAVAEGGHVIPPTVIGTILSHIAGQSATRGVAGLTAAVRMTKREQGIIRLIGEGLSNKEIAQRLDIATYTVKSHVHNILEKLALHSRLQIAAHAHRVAGSTTD